MFSSGFLWQDSVKGVIFYLMRYGILADIHGNLAAFTAAMDDMGSHGEIAELWCLGDTVGYGPAPHECLEMLRGYKHVCVAGNHDWAAIGKLDTFGFNSDAAAACYFTAQKLTKEDIDYLASLPERASRENFTLVHGSPRDPLREYILSPKSAAENLGYFDTPFCLVGHSHIPLAVTYDGSGRALFHEFGTGGEIKLGKGQCLINPGSVGQPRDGDPRASYAIYDSESECIRNFRVPYDIGRTQEKMRHFALPERLISRLTMGI